MSDLKTTLPGRFIVIDGPDGAGKTTQLKLLADHLRKEGLAVEVVVDPGTTKIGDKIRNLLLDRDSGEIAAMCETLLFMASRAQLVHERVRPALAARKVVLCDRFISASLAYQGAAGVDSEKIIQLGDIAVEGLWPDVTLILDVTVEEGNKRIGVVRERLKRPAQEELQRSGSPETGKREHEPPRGQMFLFGDRIEAQSRGYHGRVRELFLKQAADDPVHFTVIDGSLDAQQVHRRILEVLGSWPWLRGKDQRRR
jgi:dTMP kinase